MRIKFLIFLVTAIAAWQPGYGPAGNSGALAGERVKIIIINRSAYLHDRRRIQRYSGFKRNYRHRMRVSRSQRYLGFKRGYRGQRYTGFKKTYRGAHYLTGSY